MAADTVAEIRDQEYEATLVLKVAGTAAALSIVPRSVLGGGQHIPPSEKINVACIGVGGQGASNVKGLSSQNLVAFADVDDQRAAKTYKEFPAVKQYRDYRRLIDEMHGKLDAVAVSTPDHMHFHPAFLAMQHGLHVYLEKPLAHNVREIRALTELARKKNLATQLGAATREPQHAPRGRTCAKRRNRRGPRGA